MSSKYYIYVIIYIHIILIIFNIHTKQYIYKLWISSSLGNQRAQLDFLVALPDEVDVSLSNLWQTTLCQNICHVSLFVRIHNMSTCQLVHSKLCQNVHQIIRKDVSEHLSKLKASYVRDNARVYVRDNQILKLYIRVHVRYSVRGQNDVNVYVGLMSYQILCERMWMGRSHGKAFDMFRVRLECLGWWQIAGQKGHVGRCQKSLTVQVKSMSGFISCHLLISFVFVSAS